MKRYILWLLTVLAMLTAPVLAANAADALQSTLSKPSLLIPTTQPEVPDPEQAFRVSVQSRDASTLLVRFKIDDCCYLYRDKIRLSLVGADGKTEAKTARLGDYALPPGKVKNDQYIGKAEIYHDSVDVTVPVEGDTRGLSLKAIYQGCSEKGVQICFPPATKTIALTGSISGVAPSAPASGGFWLALVAAFGAGLLLSFTPCVLPMIPILSGVIVEAEGRRITKLRGGLLSYIYVLGTAVTYLIAGAIAGATGEQLQAYFQNAWAIGIFSVILVLLALSMFGLYELQVPSSIQSLLHSHSSKLHGRAKGWVAGEFIGVFFLGLISALIIGACVSPILVSVLGAAVASHDPWLGAGVMFALAHGQGIILIAVGVSEGVLLPKAGPWMDAVKHVFGVMLIAVAIYLLGFLPQVPVLLLWGVLFIVCAVYLGATQRLPQHSDGWRYLWKGLGTVFLIWGVLALIGGFTGGRDVLNPLPLSLLHGSPTTTPVESVFERVKTTAQLDTRLKEAKLAGKPIVLDYYADWCTDCIRMEKATLADTDVRAELTRRFVRLQVDVTDSNDPQSKALKNRFGVYGPPATLFFASNGNEHREMRSYGFLDKAAFMAILQRVE